MYERLAEFYEEIFPLNPLTLDFILKCLPNPKGDSATLDVGCATGELCRALLERGHPVVGIEPDREMVALAIERSGGEIPFYPLGMEDVGTRFPENAFTAVLCLGNTLAHLKNFNAIQDFLSDVARVLSPDGHFIFQIVNFDRLSLTQLPDFPVIERRGFRFVRQYEWIDEHTAIRFITTLENLSNNTSKTGSCRLFPATKAQLSTALTTAGFSTQNWFGNFKGDAFTPKSPAAICVAEIVKL
ncbi:MAG: hypothetical protein DRJ14_08150 [Acidobacteria bacterium]|nr:MAG: hypothetical protein DRJ14_08150 [Acidobacteriota bacterium]